MNSKGIYMIELVNVKKTYKAKKTSDTIALDGVNFKIPSKGLYFITGESGSGKSTLLNVLGGLDKIDTGSIKVGNIALENLSKKDLVKYRNTCVGFIFQDYNLFLEYNVYDNVKLALELSNQNNNTNIDEILKRVGLYDLRLRNINELSGGQRQRVAIARALVKNPEIILADEPTGNLDSVTSRQIMTLLKEISADKCVIVVTHDRTLANEFGNGFIMMQDGKVLNDTIVALKNDEKDIALRTSNFKNRYALKFTLHNMKMKPVKFVMTTLLTAFALTLVCLMFTFVLFNKQKFALNTLMKHNVDKIAISPVTCFKDKVYSDYVDCNPKYFNNDDETLKLGSPAYTGRDNEFALKFGKPTNITEGIPSYNNIVELKDDILITLYLGRLPLNDTEIVIDKNIAYNIIKYGIYDTNQNLIKPTTMQDILNLQVNLGKYPVTIVGINEFNNDHLFTSIRSGEKTNIKLQEYFKSYTEDNNIYVKGFIDNKELLYSEEEMLSKFIISFTSKFNTNVYGMLHNLKYYETEEYYDLDFNLTNKPLGSKEVIISASDILNYNSPTTGDIGKKFAEFQKENNNLSYSEALPVFIKDIFIKYKDEFNLVSRDMVKVYRDSNYTTILKVAGVTFDDYSYISKEMYNNGDKSKKFIEKIYIGFKTKDELNNLLTKYDYMNNIHEEGNYLVMESDLGGDIGTIDNIYYHLHTYLVIIACVVAIFALILLFNFINTTISYAKKNIGILKSLGAKNKDIYKIFTYEAVIITVIAFILSILMWTVACNFANKMFFDNYEYIGGIQINALAPFLTLSFGLVLSWLLSLANCSRINEMQPVDAILNK